MRYLLGFLITGVLVAAPMPALRQSRKVTCDQETNIPLAVGQNMVTVIAMPQGEYIYNVFGGDEANWAIGTSQHKAGESGAAAQPSRYLPIKPKTKGARTVLTVIGNGGTNCAFTVTEGGPEVDTRVFIEGTGEGGVTAFEKLQWVPASEVASYKQGEEAAKKEAAEAVKAADAKVTVQVDAFKVQYPATLRFPYVVDQECAARLSIEEIWHDDKFTYIRSHNQNAPVVYGKDEGKPSLIKSSLDSDLYVVDKILREGYFLIGTKKQNKCEFHDKEAR